MEDALVAKKIVLLFLLVGIFGFAFGYLFLPNKNNQASRDESLISRHFLKEDSKVYENTRLGYAIDYPRGTEVYDCPDISCASIDNLTLRLEPLRFYGKDEILRDDLYCSSDGPQGSVYCLDRRVEEFTNDEKTDGFLVRQKKIIELNEYDEYEDVAYVFPIRDNPDYKAVLLSVDIPDSNNLSGLENIANSFRLISVE